MSWVYHMLRRQKRVAPRMAHMWRNCSTFYQVLQIYKNVVLENTFLNAQADNSRYDINKIVSVHDERWFEYYSWFLQLNIENKILMVAKTGKGALYSKYFLANKLLLQSLKYCKVSIIMVSCFKHSQKNSTTNI